MRESDGALIRVLGVRVCTRIYMSLAKMLPTLPILPTPLMLNTYFVGSADVALPRVPTSRQCRQCGQSEISTQRRAHPSLPRRSKGRARLMSARTSSA
jgi:hypothetical protein